MATRPSGGTPPLLSIAVTPASSADEEKLTHGLARLAAEDPALHVKADRVSGAIVIAGASELHIENVVDRLRREFGVEASVGRPQVAFREALTRPADGEAKYARQRGGRSEYGHVRLRASPGEPGSGCSSKTGLSTARFQKCSSHRLKRGSERPSRKG